MMRHPLEDFVKSELAYRAERWPHPSGEDAHGRGLGRLRRRRDVAAAPPCAAAFEVPSPPAPHDARLAVIHPLRKAGRRHDAA
jgi:hypothetical protein